jgi:transcriptional regulator with XRE-family HTH domain
MATRLEKKIGGKINEACADEGLDVPRLAGKISRSSSQTYKYFQGENITIEVLENIAKACRRPMEWFVAGISGETVVAEQGAWYEDPKRRELIIAVKELVRDADDDVITALLHNVKIFRRTIKKEKT